MLGRVKACRHLDQVGRVRRYEAGGLGGLRTDFGCNHTEDGRLQVCGRSRG